MWNGNLPQDSQQPLQFVAEAVWRHSRTGTRANACPLPPHDFSPCGSSLRIRIVHDPNCPLALDGATASFRVHSTGLPVKPGHSEFAMLAFDVESHHAVKIPIKTGKGVVDRQAVCSILEQLLAADGSVELFLHWQQCRNEYHSAGSSTPTKHARSRFYWATAGCGGPSQGEAPRWPRKQTVSDGKTSVGMDRTRALTCACPQRAPAESRQTGATSIGERSSPLTMPSGFASQNPIGPHSKKGCFHCAPN